MSTPLGAGQCRDSGTNAALCIPVHALPRFSRPPRPRRPGPTCPRLCPRHWTSAVGLHNGGRRRGRLPPMRMRSDTRGRAGRISRPPHSTALPLLRGNLPRTCSRANPWPAAELRAPPLAPGGRPPPRRRSPRQRLAGSTPVGTADLGRNRQVANGRRAHRGCWFSPLRPLGDGVDLCAGTGEEGVSSTSQKQ